MHGLSGPRGLGIAESLSGSRGTLQRLQEPECDPHAGEGEGGQSHRGGPDSGGEGAGVLKAPGRLPLDLRKQPCFPRDESGTTMPKTPGPLRAVLPSKLPDVWLRNAAPSLLCSVQEQKGKSSK